MNSLTNIANKWIIENRWYCCFRPNIQYSMRTLSFYDWNSNLFCVIYEEDVYPNNVHYMYLCIHVCTIYPMLESDLYRMFEVIGSFEPICVYNFTFDSFKMLMVIEKVKKNHFVQGQKLSSVQRMEVDYFDIVLNKNKFRRWIQTHKGLSPSESNK